MKPFTHNELLWIRGRLAEGYTMQQLCDINPFHTRDEIVEAIDALHRFPNTHDAQRHVNQVLAYQEADIPLVNGKPMRERLNRPVAMF